MNGNKVTVTVKGGTPSRVVTNPKKESKVVSSTLTSSNSSSFPTTDSYNSGGFSGTLNRQGSPERYTITTEGGSSTYCGKQCYNRGGTWEEEDRCYDDCTSSNTEYRYRQTYSGTVYKSGPDNYYSYSVVLNYIDNTTPTIATGTLPTITINANGEITITGTVTDPDDDTITISSAINGVTKSITVPGPTSNKPWSLTWTGTELAEGMYNNIVITANDGNGETDSKTYTGSITVDKTAPTKPTLASSKTTPTNQNINVTIGYPADSSLKQYKIGTGAWTTYTVPVVVTANTTVYARATDLAGNVSAEGSLVIGNIDKVVPIITVDPYNTDWTNEDIVVTVKTTKGTLNETSYTFTSNGSFTFTATDPAGNTASKVVKVENIDKTKPVIEISIRN